MGEPIGFGKVLMWLANQLASGQGWLGLATLVAFAAPVADRYVIRRKRLRYKVFYNSKLGLSPVALHDADSSDQAEPQLRQLSDVLGRMSIAIIRIRNSGSYHIQPGDFEEPISFTFGGRIVWDARISGTTDDLQAMLKRNLRFFRTDRFAPDPDAVVETVTRDGLRDTLGRRLLNLIRTDPPAEPEPAKEWHGVRLTRLSLNTQEKFTLVVVLQEPQPNQDRLTTKKIRQIGRMKEGGRIKDETTERRITLPRVAILTGILLTGALIARAVLIPSAHPVDPGACVSGPLRITGSSAMMPTVETVAKRYHGLCSGADIQTDATASLAAVEDLQNAPQDGSRAALSDGLVKATPTPPPGIAVLIYAMAVNNSAGVSRLSSDQLRGIYTGQLTNWSQLGGANQDIRIVSRSEDSGTRLAFQKTFLGPVGQNPPPSEVPLSSTDCATKDSIPNAPMVRCVRASTQDLLVAVSRIPGAIGYADAIAAEDQRGVTVAQVDDEKPGVNDLAPPGSPHGYRFWTIEYLYTQAPPAPGSVLSGFLDYLSGDVGRAELRRAGYLPCVDRPDLCGH